MSKHVAGILAVILLSMPATAMAKDKNGAGVQAVLACERVSLDEARLRCFDQAIIPLKQALGRGSIVLEERRVPLALEGVVKASGQSGASRYWVELENGDRWSLLPKSSRPKAPPPGTTVRMKKTLWGGYWISGPGWSESEAAFLGHGS